MILKKKNSPTFSLSTEKFESKDAFKDYLLTIDESYVKKASKYVYYNIPLAFDIETSSFYENNEKRAIMYAFVLGINGKCWLGRTWADFFDYLNIIHEVWNINESRKIIIWVHNLSYEFQFIRKRFKWKEVFSLDLRKPAKAETIDGIIFRCSYILSNSSLNLVGTNLIKYKVKKMIGDLDYNLIRTSDTYLNDKELKYILNDGLVVMAYIQELIEKYQTLANLPLTFTGFVRQICKKNCFGTKKEKSKYFTYTKIMNNLILNDTNEYKLLRLAYQGGFTHANAFNSNKICYNVNSYDLTSSYPTVLVAEEYPISTGEYIIIKNKDEFIKNISTYCCVFEITFYDLESIVFIDHPISKGKCTDIEEPYQVDNGRIINAKKISCVITEQDYLIYRKFYKWSSITIGHFIRYEKNYLPKDFILSILNFYKTKTILKDVEGQEEEYMTAKQHLNSIYGMTVTDIYKDDIEYINDEWVTMSPDIDAKIEKYNKSRKRFLFYGWGVWCTAYARRNLFTAIYELGSDYIYSDTDSVKYMNKDNHEKYFNDYNINIINKLKYVMKINKIDESYILPKNKFNEEKPLGIWTYEGQYEMFKTLGAKRYMYIKNNKLYITISGINKIDGAKYLEYKYKTPINILNNFKDEMLFPASYTIDNIEYSATGKKTHTYIDEAFSGKIKDYLDNISFYSELSAIHMENCDYSLSLANSYLDYLLQIKEEE